VRDHTVPSTNSTSAIAIQKVTGYPTMTHDLSGRLSLTGNGADIVINGVSINDTLIGIQERLAILQPNPELEKEFLALATIRNEYIKLEKKLLEKKAVWEALKRDD
jgi:hypothetical protein